MCIFTVLYVEHVELNVFVFVAVRAVAAGHQMIAEGHRTVAKGWALFKEVVEEGSPGDLPQLLRQLKGKTMPPPSSPMDVSQGEPRLGTPAMPSPVQKEEGKSEDPVMVMISGHRHGTCPQCNTVRGSKNGCDAHIRQAHTGKAFVCSFDSFSMYKFDLLMRHEKEHQ